MGRGTDSPTCITAGRPPDLKASFGARKTDSVMGSALLTYFPPDSPVKVFGCLRQWTQTFAKMSGPLNALSAGHNAPMPKLGRG